MRRKLILITILLMYSKILYGYSYLGIEYGDIVGYFGVRNLGMGGTSIASADDYSAFLSNPAAAYNFTKKIGVAFSLNYFNGSERVLDYESTESFESSFSKFNFNSFGIYSRPAEFVSVGFAYHPVNDQNYESEHYIPENTSEKNGIKYINSSGTLNSYSFGISVNIKEYGAAGISFSILKGSQDIIQGIDYYESTGLQDQKSENHYTASGSTLNIGIGLVGKPLKTVQIGGFIRTGTKIEFKKDEKLDYTFEIPSQYGAGIFIKSLFGYDTFFAFDFIYKNWEDTIIEPAGGNEYTPAGFHNTYEFHTGVEHILIFRKTKVPVRFGFYFQPFYGNDAYDKAVFTFGAGLWGYPLPELKLDFGVEFGKRNYLGDNAYFDRTKYIDETLLNFVFEVKYEIK